MKYKTLLLAVLCCAAPTAFADDGKLSFYAHLKGSSFTVDDPNGNTDTDVTIVPGIRAMLDLSVRGSRLVTGFDFLTAESDAGVSVIHQDVSGYSMFVGFEKRVALSRNTKLWFGGALTYSDVEFSERFTIDADGFLAEAYSDRSEGYAGVSLTADTYFDMTKKLKFGIGAFVDVPFSDGVTLGGVRVSIGRGN